MIRSAVIFVLALCFVLSGCSPDVSQEDHDEVISQLDSSTILIDDLQKNGIEMAEQFSVLQDEYDQISYELETAQSALKDMQSDINSLMNQLAQYVDSHGCIKCAGYEWCASRGECIRVGEDDCTFKDPVTITIGHLSDITGPSANSTNIVDAALNDTVNYYNEHNLIPGVELRLVTYDGQFDPSKDIPGYEWLRQKGSDLIFTPVPSTQITLRPIVEHDKMVLFSLDTPADSTTQGYEFSLNLDPRHDAYTLLDWIAENDPDFPQDRPAKIGGAGWAEPYSIAVLDGIEQYCKAHPNQFEWAGGFLTNYSFSWGPEVEALKDCDYIIPPVYLTSFIREFRNVDHSAKFIGTKAHTTFFSMITDAGLWDDIDEMLFTLPHRWWNEYGPVIDLTNTLLNQNHPNDAEDIAERGSGYLAVHQIFIMLEIIKEAVKSVGPENFDSEALYEAAQLYSFMSDGTELYSFTDTKRTAVNYIGIYEALGDEKDIFRADPEWIPIVQEP